MADTPIVNINISEILVTNEDVVICTVLGSCVSVCLFAENQRGGGMIHYALPEHPSEKKPDPLRYGDYAILELITQVCQLTGLSPRKLKAKVIGGANNIASKNESHDVGTANVMMAKKILAENEIQIIGEEIGGDIGRKILFHVKTGRLQSAFVGPGFTRPSAKLAANTPKKTG